MVEGIIIRCKTSTYRMIAELVENLLKTNIESLIQDMHDFC